jgi:dihydroflavonol-4-reductase
MKKIFVTGSSGLLGTNLIMELLEQGYYVSGLVRNPVNYRGYRHERLQLIQGSIFDDLNPKMAGCDSVIHLAAETGQDIPDYKHYHKVNVNGTLRVIKAAIQNKVKNFIYASSANTVGGDDKDSAGMKFPFTRSNYARSKKAAENAILGYRDRIKVVIANPTFMLGAHDSKPTSGKIILRGLNKKLLLHPPGGKNFIHVRDVAKGLISCLDKGKNGQRYVMAGENLSFRQFYSRLNRLTGQRSIFVQVPKSLLLAGGYIGDLFLKMGFRTNISSVNMHSLCMHNYYHTTGNQEELEISYSGIDTAIQDCYDYFKNQKLQQEL